MNRFSISDLEHFSGIKAHTIRMWENRYNALTPGRSDGNIRYYDNTQLQRLLNIVNLQKIGFKISNLCFLDDNALNLLIEDKIINIDSENEALGRQNSLLMAGLEFDNTTFHQLCEENEERYGILDNYSKILLPLLQRIGLLWNISNISIAHEHFITHHIKRRLYATLSNINTVPPKNSPHWVLFLPEDEYHDIGLLISAYFLEESGNTIIYLGSTTPLSVVHEVTTQVPIQNLLFFWVRNENSEGFISYTKEIIDLFPTQNIYIAAKGDLLQQLPFKSVIKLSSITDLIASQKKK